MKNTWQRQHVDTTQNPHIIKIWHLHLPPITHVFFFSCDIKLSVSVSNDTGALDVRLSSVQNKKLNQFVYHFFSQLSNRILKFKRILYIEFLQSWIIWNIFLLKSWQALTLGFFEFFNIAVSCIDIFEQVHWYVRNFSWFGKI